ncbi:hypothetical protein G3N57_06895 [Paraburkholderia sp. Se-20369]|nr:hypothetical protein [Paraburkholderia sp. Se-20369]
MPPSLAVDFLRCFIGKRVVSLVRYSWWPAEEVAGECGIKNSDAFSLTAGPLVICFDGGGILGVASSPELNSVVVWDEGGRRSGQNRNGLDKDGELFPISGVGSYASEYWGGLINRPLSKVVVLKRENMNAKKQGLPSEVGLRFMFEGGESFIASHGLHDDSDDFSVLEESQLLPIPLRETMWIPA